MPTVSRKPIARLALVLVVLLAATFSAFFVVPPKSAKATLMDLGYPWAGATAISSVNGDWGYTTCPSNDSGCMNPNFNEVGTDGKTYGVLDPYGYYLRYCTSFVAWKLVSLGVPASKVEGLKNGGQWYDNAPNGLSKGSTPQTGDAAVIPATYDSKGNLKTYGHVAYVDKVNYDSNGNATSFEVQQSNADYMGDQDQSTYNVQGSSFTEFIHFASLMTNPPSNTTPIPTPTPAPPIIALKSARSPDGSAIEVYAATNGRVTQHWYHDGGDSGTADLIDQANIVGIDKLNQANGTESLYTAVPDGVYETWWNSSSNGPQTSKIVYPGLRGITLSGVRGVIAENTIESGVTVHHLYILASDGPYEAWWKDGGDGVHLGRLIQINGPVAFTHSVGPDGSEQLYVAVPTWVYEVEWIPGSGVVRMHNIINITQGDIKSIDKGALLPDGSQLLYTTTSTAVWQTWWATDGGPYYNGTIATGQTNALQGLKVVTPDGVHHIYLALPDHVQEYWWLGANSGGGELIRISQGNITAISQILDGSMQLLLTAAGNNVWETWWNSSQAPTTPSTPLFSVTA